MCQHVYIAIVCLGLMKGFVKPAGYGKMRAQEQIAAGMRCHLAFPVLSDA